MNQNVSNNEIEFSIVDGGPLDRGLNRAGLNKPGAKFLGLRLAALAVVSWLPLLILSAKAGLMLGDTVQIPFLHDFAVHVRLLLAMPLLLVAEMVITPRLGAVIRHFVTSGLIIEQDLPDFRQAIADAVRWKESYIAELIILTIVVVLNVSHFGVASTSVMNSWHEIRSEGEMELTTAGWWYYCVSAPIFQLFLYRWLWRFVIWSNLLRRIAKLDLQLFPTHPDHAGGLGFLGTGQSKFAVIILALSAVMAASIANRVLYGGESLVSFKFMIAMFVVLNVVIFLGPLMVFTPKLAALKRKGLLEYSALSTAYVRAFDQKWLRGGNEQNEPLLGTGDIQSLADLSTSVENIGNMKTFPFNLGIVKSLVVVAALPFLPLVATIIPLKDLLGQIMAILL
jgi:hypothetical protein